MGRRTATSYDDELTTKLRGVVTDVLDRLHRHCELGNVRALYSPSMQARIDADPPGASGSLPESEKFPYTFEHFVEHLDPADSTVNNLLELLITLTARQAISSAVEQTKTADMAEASALLTDIVPFPPASTLSAIAAAMHRTSATAHASASEVSSGAYRLNQLRTATERAVRAARECQREMALCRAVQGEIRIITRRNRRSRSSDDSDSSSESLQFTSPPLTRTVFSTLVDPRSESNDRANAAATTRVARVGQRDRGDAEQGYHWIQRDLSSIRRRMDQRREDSIGRLNAARGVGATWNSSSLLPTSSAADTTINVLASETAGGQLPVLLSSDVADTTGSTFVRRFLSQPFPSDVRRSSLSAAAAAATMAVQEGNDPSIGLNATISPQVLTPQSPVLFTNTAAALDPADVDVIEDDDAAASSATNATESGSQARLEAVQAALNRLNPSASGTGAEDSADFLSNFSRRHTDRTNEFEAFSAQRRVLRRASRMDMSRDGLEADDVGRTSLANEEDAHDAADRALMESAVFQLARADDTIRRITNEHTASDARDAENEQSASGSLRARDPLARRLELPLNNGRAIAHLPPRSRTRSFHRDEDAVL